MLVGEHLPEHFSHLLERAVQSRHQIAHEQTVHPAQDAIQKIAELSRPHRFRDV